MSKSKEAEHLNKQIITPEAALVRKNTITSPKLEIVSMWEAPVTGKLYNPITRNALDEKGVPTNIITEAINGQKKREATPPHSLIQGEVVWIQEKGIPATGPIKPQVLRINRKDL